MWEEKQFLRSLENGCKINQPLVTYIGCVVGAKRRGGGGGCERENPPPFFPSSQNPGCMSLLCYQHHTRQEGHGVPSNEKVSFYFNKSMCVE